MNIYPNNTLQQVQTYQRASLGLLQNLNCFIGEVCNTKFKEFNKISTNLGSTVTFDLPPRFASSQGLVITFQGAQQRVLSLTCDQAQNVAYPFTAQERIFNVDKDADSYLEEFGRSAVAELGANIEANIALNANSSAPVNMVVDGQTVPTGALHTESGPYRFFGDGLTAINSFQQLQQMIENYRAYGATKDGKFKVILPNTVTPPIVGTGLNQFALDRNDEMAMSWQLGSFGGADYYVSNLLPIHTSGDIGNATGASNVLTVVSTNDPTGNNITSITFNSPLHSNGNAILSGDLIQFRNVNFLTFIGHKPTSLPLQVRATANATTDGSGNITVSIAPALQSTPGGNQNITNNIIAGQTASVLASHQCGLVVGGDAFYLAMPQLPSQSPFEYSNEADPDTHVSIRLTHGTVFGQNQYGIYYDATWGAVAVPEYTMRIAFPLNV